MYALSSDPRVLQPRTHQQSESSSQILGTNKHVLCRIKNDDGVLLTCISNFDKSYTVRELGEGEELFVNYGSERGFESSPIEMFVDYGFVPEEMLEVAHGPPGDDEDFDIYDD